MQVLDRFFYYPNTHYYGSPGDCQMRWESVSFEAEDRTRLHGWFFPADSEPEGTVLHLHGNAGNITGHFQHTAWLPAFGWNVLCFDYRGYGQSDGWVTRSGTVADAHAALDHLLSREDVDSKKIVAFGQSLGGAVGVVLAAERTELRGLATDGAFDSYRRVARWHIRQNPFLAVVGQWFPSVFMTGRYDPIDYVARIAPRPLFLMHGTSDRVVSPEMSERLYQAAGMPKNLWMVEGADHYEALEDESSGAYEKLLRFFSNCVDQDGEGSQPALVRSG